MTLDWAKFHAAYSKASDSIRSLIDSEALPKCAADICLKYNLSEELKKELVVCALAKLLAIETDEIIIANLEKEGISNEDSYSILIEIEQCIIENTSQKLEANEVYDEISQVEASLSSLPTIRTMASDSTLPENTYSSVQSAILNEGK